MTTPAALGRKQGAAQEGFVLVGVIVFTLALTILSLSLFSLSGFEAQFWNRSLEEEQAFYYAVGGLERAKMVLAATDDLDQVRIPAGQSVEGVDYVSAVQNEDKPDQIDSTGSVAWYEDSVITIRARAVYKRAKRMVEARYAPSRPENPYRYLMSISSPAARAMSVHPVDDGGQDRTAQTAFVGIVSPLTPPAIWQNSADEAWRDSVMHPEGPGALVILRRGGVARPDVDGFLSRYYDASVDTPQDESSGSTYILGFDATGLPYKFFRDYPPGFPAPPDPDWSFNWKDSGDLTIHVGGIVIWMLPDGVRIQARVNVAQYAKAVNQQTALIIVAGPGTDPARPGTGIAFVGGMTSLEASTFLVSNGRVSLEHEYNPDRTTESSFLSIYADKVSIMGPRSQYMKLRHPTSAVQHLAGGLLDILYENDLLPNSDVAVGVSFRQIPGRWREIPTN